MVAAVVAGLVAFACSIAFTRWLLTRLARLELFQPINQYVKHHASNPRKARVPTMGGAAVVVAAVVGALAGMAVAPSAAGASAGLVLAACIGAGAVGLTDDVLKIRNDRRKAQAPPGAPRPKVNEGVTPLQKSVGQVAVGLVVGLGCVAAGVGDRILVPFVDEPWHLGAPVVVVLSVVLVWFWSNAVNMTDGLDGLAGGSCVLTFGSLALAAFWMFRHPDYGIDGALGVAVVAAAFATACAGYLWWNMFPASVMMGDGGALAFGAVVATLALALGLPLLLPLFGGLFLVEFLSVFALAIWLRILKKASPLQRFEIFRRPENPFHAPIHHEFQQRHEDKVVAEAHAAWQQAVAESPELAQAGQPKPPRDDAYEPTLVMRLWLCHAICVAGGLAILYGDWLGRIGG